MYGFYDVDITIYVCLLSSKDTTERKSKKNAVLGNVFIVAFTHAIVMCLIDNLSLESPGWFCGWTPIYILHANDVIEGMTNGTLSKL